MTEYEQYVDAVNKIYSYLEMMKTVWTDQDNISYLDNLETYKQIESQLVSRNYTKGRRRR